LEEEGDIKFGEQAYVEALECYDKALEINPQYATAWYCKGAVLYRMEQKSEALQCYDKSITIDPLFKLAWSNKG